MNKVFVLPPNEDWIVDRLVREWNEDNADICVTNPELADVIWLMSDWCWKKIPDVLLKSKKVLTTVHHIVPEKFGEQEKIDFMMRDEITSVYHVPNQYTHNFIRNLTEKTIHIIPYWANQNIWKNSLLESKASLRKKYNIPEDSYVIGSFQRDTESHDLKSPKLEKGPDLLTDFLESLHKKSKRPIHVVLSGWRRQYVINRLKKSNIDYSYFERPSQKIVNDLYQTLDLYPVTARHEGGPQSLIECGLLNIPVVSRPVGIADSVLSSSTINDNVELCIPEVPNVDFLKLPYGYKIYRNLIESM